MGSVIGHEMTHGFDDQGSHFDSTGNLANWWSEADLKSFKERAQCVYDQLNGFEVEKGLNQKRQAGCGRINRGSRRLVEPTLLSRKRWKAAACDYGRLYTRTKIFPWAMRAEGSNSARN